MGTCARALALVRIFHVKELPVTAAATVVNDSRQMAEIDRGTERHTHKEREREI